MKVLFVTNQPNYCHKRFAEAVGAEFYRVKHFVPDGIPIVSLPINGWFNSRKLPEADVYFAESIMDYYPVFYKNPKGKKVILIAEDTLFKLEGMSKPKREFILKLFRSADGFVAISDLCKELLSKYVDKPCVVAYPFPHEDFSDVNADMRQKNILFIGRADKTKGYLKLVEAVKILREKALEWTLYLIGKCSEDVKEEIGIKPMGVVKDMAPYFERCSVLVHPADFDPCPATVFEAMQAGIVPIISGNIGQSKIFLENGMKSLVLDSTDPKVIAAKIEELQHKGLKIFSYKAKQLVSTYNEVQRLSIFKREFSDLMKEMGVIV